MGSGERVSSGACWEYNRPPGSHTDHRRQSLGQAMAICTQEKVGAVSTKAWGAIKKTSRF